MKDLSTSKTILVPHDFTAVADTAIQHGNHIAKLLDKSLTLLHVIEKESEREKATEKLKNIAETNFEKSGVPTEAIIVVGSIFTEIGKAADVAQAGLVVMGTHGVKGIQRLVGSYALKVITNSNVPYIVVQEKSYEPDGYKNMVLPMDFVKESKQKLAWAIYIAKLFQSKCHLVVEYHSDEFIAKAIHNNVAYAKAVLSDNGIDDVAVHQLDKKSGEFGKEVIKYSKSVNAGLIILMTTLDKSISEYFLGPVEQNIIANEAQIPVMTIKPYDISVMADGFSIMYFG